MTFKEWVASIFGLEMPSTPDEGTDLDTHQNQIAGRLAKMQGSTRDEVLSEAYRRARLAKEAQSFRPRQ